MRISFGGILRRVDFLTLFGCDNTFHPVRHRIQQFRSDVSVLATGASRHMKRMIRILKQLERCPATELFAERLQELQVRELIASALKEEHRNLHVKKMLRPFVRRSSGWVEWKSKKHKAAHSGQRRCGLR